MSSDHCGSRLFLALPDDILTIITSSLSVGDLCNLGLTCPGLDSFMSSHKVWLFQCDKLGLVPYTTLIEWRKGVFSYKALCRFLVNIQPLIGTWVHRNPELMHVVYVMPGFLSVVGCRIIPQKIGPLGLEDGSILWTPVFEILCNHVGSTSFFLHGRERGVDYVYPGLLKSVNKDCNVLLLEIEHRHQWAGGKLADLKNFAHEVDNEVSSSQRIVGQKRTEKPFIRLESDDRELVLEFVTSQVRDIVPDAANVLLFPRPRIDAVDSQQDFIVLHERRLLLLQMYERGNMNHDLKSDEGSPLNPTELGSSEVYKSLDCTCNYPASQAGDATLHEFLQLGDWVGLSLQAETKELYSCKYWPYRYEILSAFYKFPIRAPKACDEEFAGLWGGTFGLPPSADKPGKPLFLIFISYEETKGQQQMYANKILEGKSRVSRPNGSTMFVVNIDEPSMTIFPWNTDKQTNSISVKQSFKGEGISDGYRYRSIQPGSLFVLENGLIVFLWEHSRDLLTLKRLDLGELLRRGERLPSFPPVLNFAHLTSKYRNIYPGFSHF
ncbi:hypothetical protein ABFS83_12G036600 [Erythranthe nasuta]